MKDINSVTLSGRLTKDIDLRYFQSGSAVGEFSIATNTTAKKSDQWVDEGNFFDCVLFGRQAEALAPYLKKGTPIFIIAILKQNRWTDNNGQNRSKVVLNIQEIKLASNQSTKNPQTDILPKATMKVDDFQSDIPF